VHHVPAHAELGRQFVWFAAIGVIGFLVDAVVFFTLNSNFGWSIGGARAISASCSIATTWALNRRFTFGAYRSKRWRAELVRYAVGQGAGLIVNLAAFALILLVAPPPRSTPIIALCLGAAAALLFNFLTARMFAFRADTR
jgi:putative flippase GtrA